MPNFDFRCPGCGCAEERIVPYAERLTQSCSRCQTTLTWVFTPTRQKPVVYGSTSTHPPHFTGPRQRARLLRESNQIELGDASPAEVEREFNRWGKEADERHEADLLKTAESIVSDLGGELYTRE